MFDEMQVIVCNCLFQKDTKMLFDQKKVAK